MRINRGFPDQLSLTCVGKNTALSHLCGLAKMWATGIFLDDYKVYAIPPQRVEPQNPAIGTHCWAKGKYTYYAFHVFGLHPTAADAKAELVSLKQKKKNVEPGDYGKLLCCTLAGLERELPYPSRAAIEATTVVKKKAAVAANKIRQRYKQAKPGKRQGLALSTPAVPSKKQVSLSLSLFVISP